MLILPDKVQREVDEAREALDRRVGTWRAAVTLIVIAAVLIITTWGTL